MLEQLRKQAKDLAREKNLQLAAAQLGLARSYGFSRWERLLDHVRGVREHHALETPLIRPVELRSGRPYTLQDGTVVTGARAIRRLTSLKSPTTHRPSTFAVPEAHFAIVPWATPLSWAVQKGHDAVAARLRAAGA